MGRKRGEGERGGREGREKEEKGGKSVGVALIY